MRETNEQDQPVVYGRNHLEIAGSNVRVQIRDFHLRGIKHMALDREYYGVGYSIYSSNNINVTTPGGGPRTTCATGSIAVLRPKVPFQFELHPGHHRLIHCLFEPDYFEEITGIDKIDTSRDILSYLNFKNPFLATLFRKMQEELENPGFASELLVDSASNLCLFEIASHTKKIAKGSQPSRRQGRGLSPQQLRRISERIAAIDEVGIPSLAELAQICGMSRFHMLRNFKISTGSTIHAHIEQIRLTRAKELLSDGDLSAKAIAYKLGFCSPTHFSTTFRRLTSMSPTEFRARSCS